MTHDVECDLRDLEYIRTVLSKTIAREKKRFRKYEC